MIKHLTLFSISYKPAKGELWLETDFRNKMFCVKKASMQILELCGTSKFPQNIF